MVKAELLMGIDQIDEMVRNGATLIGGRFGSADVHVPVKRHGIERNDFGIEMLGQMDADTTFSAGGGSREEPALLKCFDGKLHGIRPFRSLNRLFNMTSAANGVETSDRSEEHTSELQSH